MNFKTTCILCSFCKRDLFQPSKYNIFSPLSYTAIKDKISDVSFMKQINNFFHTRTEVLAELIINIQPRVDNIDSSCKHRVHAFCLFEDIKQQLEKWKTEQKQQLFFKCCGKSCSTIYHSVAALQTAVLSDLFVDTKEMTVVNELIQCERELLKKQLIDMNSFKNCFDVIGGQISTGFLKLKENIQTFEKNQLIQNEIYSDEMSLEIGDDISITSNKTYFHLLKETRKPSGLPALFKKYKVRIGKKRGRKPNSMKEYTQKSNNSEKAEIFEPKEKSKAVATTSKEKSMSGGQGRNRLVQSTNSKLRQGKPSAAQAPAPQYQKISSPEQTDDEIEIAYEKRASEENKASPHSPLVSAVTNKKPLQQPKIKFTIPKKIPETTANKTNALKDNKGMSAKGKPQLCTSQSPLVNLNERLQVGISGKPPVQVIKNLMQENSQNGNVSSSSTMSSPTNSNNASSQQHNMKNARVMIHRSPPYRPILPKPTVEKIVSNNSGQSLPPPPGIRQKTNETPIIRKPTSDVITGSLNQFMEVLHPTTYALPKINSTDLETVNTQELESLDASMQSLLENSDLSNPNSFLSHEQSPTTASTMNNTEVTNKVTAEPITNEQEETESVQIPAGKSTHDMPNSNEPVEKAQNSNAETTDEDENDATWSNSESEKEQNSSEMNEKPPSCSSSVSEKLDERTVQRESESSSTNSDTSCRRQKQTVQKQQDQDNLSIEELQQKVADLTKLMNQRLQSTKEAKRKKIHRQKQKHGVINSSSEEESCKKKQRQDVKRRKKKDSDSSSDSENSGSVISSPSKNNLGKN